MVVADWRWRALALSCVALVAAVVLGDVAPAEAAGELAPGWSGVATLVGRFHLDNDNGGNHNWQYQDVAVSVTVDGTRGVAAGDGQAVAQASYNAGTAQYGGCGPDGTAGEQHTTYAWRYSGTVSDALYVAVGDGTYDVGIGG